jgi:hypothetical protein
VGNKEITCETIKSRFFNEAFADPLMDNTMRGYWCEFMLAEALGESCKTVGLGWHPWDLQIGDESEAYPARLRIQVKNSARLQPWNRQTGKVSNCKYSLKWRKRPEYFEIDNPNVPCEPEGFMCDLYILCHHPVEDFKIADHRDPQQWRFYVLPVVGPNLSITDSELQNMRAKLSGNGKSASTDRQPHTLEQGIRGRPAIRALKISELSVDSLWACLA